MRGLSIRQRLDAICAMDYDFTKDADQHMAQAIEHATAVLSDLAELESGAHAHLSGYGDPRDLAVAVLAAVSDSVPVVSSRPNQQETNDA